MQINTHGTLNFGPQPFSNYVPEVLPLSSAVIVAPFWDDSDLGGLSGYAIYDVFTPATTNSTIIDSVESFLKTNISVELDLDWVLVAKWVNICPYQNKECNSPVVEVNDSSSTHMYVYYTFFCLQPNTFQVVVASNKTISYAIFTYKCGFLHWTDYNATIGYSAGPKYFNNHPLSKTPNVVNIDCLNYPTSNWSNVVYNLNKGMLI